MSRSFLRVAALTTLAIPDVARSGTPDHGMFAHDLFVTSMRDGPRTDDTATLPREHYLGCLWNMALKLDACRQTIPGQHLQHHGNRYGEGSASRATNSPEDQAQSGLQCYSLKIMGHEAQERMLRLYSREGAAAAPPLEEASWIVGLPDEGLEETFEICPGLVVVPLCMMAEVRFALRENDLTGLFYLRRADALLRSLGMHGNGTFARDHLQTALATWPIRRACDRARRVRAQARQRDQSVDIVVAHCSGDLAWLDGLSLPGNLRVLVYLKCFRGGALPGFCERLNCTSASHLDSEFPDRPCLRSDECGSYLFHIRRMYADLAEWTLFLQDDAHVHLHLGYLNLLLKSLSAGVLGSLAPSMFLHLNIDRHLAYWTPCLASAMRALGLPPAGRVATYCCSQFLVHRSLIQRRGLPFYERVDRFVRAGDWGDLAQCAYTEPQRGAPPSRRCSASKHVWRPCYIMEYLWHIIFGADPLLPRREEDTSLPLFLRFNLGGATELPTPDFSSFLWAHSPR